MGPGKLFEKALAKHNAGEHDEAIKLYKMVLSKQRMHVDANYLLGTAYAETRNFEAAQKYLQTAEKMMPGSPYIKVNLGNVYRELGQFEPALTRLSRAVELKYDLPQAHCSLGSVLYELGRFEEAEASCRRAIALNPDLAEAHNNLADILKAVGRFEEAEAGFRRALEINPYLAEAQSNLLFTFNYIGGYAPSFLVEEARKYRRILSQKPGQPFTAWQSASDPERLRVGIVSGDLCNHPVGYFLESVVKSIDYSGIELFAYTSWHGEDELTSRIKPFFSSWKSLVGMDDEAAARLIHTDALHVLMDLSGHTRHNRLPLFTWRPAPVQVSWLGYFATTGISEIDYLLADETGVPKSNHDHFTERIWYLPDTRLCFTAPDIDIEVTGLPALKTGSITFGSFQTLSKLGNSVLALWGKILSAVPDAKLRLQCKQFGDAGVAEEFVRRAGDCGIDPSRLSMHGLMSREAYLASHGEVDIILDTFPFSGGTTTCEALWMGVPTLTLAGDNLISRQGASMLSAAGLSDWIADSEADYINKAVSYAKDQNRLSLLRTGLRQQVLASPLFDAPRFARNLQEALWGMWRKRNENNQPVDVTPTDRKKVLNVGGNNKDIAIPNCFSGWQHDLLDIDPLGNPDIICDARELSKLPPSMYDAIYCCHNLEHYYAHDLKKVLHGFRSLLKEGGFSTIKVPDVISVMCHVVEKGLDIDDLLYESPAGPILVSDVIYGWKPEIERSGQDFYAHKNGFSRQSLSNVLKECGFRFVYLKSDNFEITAYAFMQKPTQDILKQLGVTANCNFEST